MPKETVNRILNSPFGLQLTSLSFLILFVMSFRPPYFWNGQVFDEVSVFEEQISFKLAEPGFLENMIGVNTAGMEKIIVEDEEEVKSSLKARSSNVEVQSSDKSSLEIVNGKIQRRVAKSSASSVTKEDEEAPEAENLEPAGVDNL